ncbi:hypothetical protein ES705_22735 [subsurface metagenome]
MRIKGDIVSDIESRKFTAVLDAMDERLDPGKIERTRIAKYLTENEPVLLRNVLPAVIAELFGGRQLRRLGRRATYIVQDGRKAIAGAAIWPKSVLDNLTASNFIFDLKTG